MLERKNRAQMDLFITGSLEKLVPADHILARVNRVLDLGWLRASRWRIVIARTTAVRGSNKEVLVPHAYPALLRARRSSCCKSTGALEELADRTGNAICGVRRATIAPRRRPAHGLPARRRVNLHTARSQNRVIQQPFEGRAFLLGKTDSEVRAQAPKRAGGGCFYLRIVPSPHHPSPSGSASATFPPFSVGNDPQGGVINKHASGNRQGRAARFHQRGHRFSGFGRPHREIAQELDAHVRPGSPSFLSRQPLPLRSGLTTSA